MSSPVTTIRIVDTDSQIKLDIKLNKLSSIPELKPFASDINEFATEADRFNFMFNALPSCSEKECVIDLVNPPHIPGFGDGVATTDELGYYLHMQENLRLIALGSATDCLSNKRCDKTTAQGLRDSAAKLQGTIARYERALKALWKYASQQKSPSP